MAPLTLIDKYHDLLRLSNEPTSVYSKLHQEDFADVINKKWPCIIQSITYIPPTVNESNLTRSSLDEHGEVHATLARRLKIQFQLYSTIAKEYQQQFPHRMPIVQNTRSYSLSR